MSNLAEGGHGFFNFFKGGHLQKRLGNPGLQRLKVDNVYLKLKSVLVCLKFI